MSTALDFLLDLDKSDSESDETHLVCHCTNGAISGCGLNVADIPLVEDATGDDDCALCVLAWSMDDRCPFGCSCDDCAS